MTRIENLETYWERAGEADVCLSVNYYFYPPARGGLNKLGILTEPLDYAIVEIVNIRTVEGQDPMLVINDWDREYAVSVITSRILEMAEGV